VRSRGLVCCSGAEWNWYSRFACCIHFWLCQRNWHYVGTLHVYEAPNTYVRIPLYVKFLGNNLTKICTFVMFVFLDFHTAVCKQCVSVLMHRYIKLSLALLTAMKRKVTENDHILLQYILPQLYIITLCCCDLTSVANVSSSPVWASAMLLLLITEQ
jgi:hypothetical protein